MGVLRFAQDDSNKKRNGAPREERAALEPTYVNSTYIPTEAVKLAEAFSVAAKSPLA